MRCVCSGYVKIPTSRKTREKWGTRFLLTSSSQLPAYGFAYLVIGSNLKGMNHETRSN